MKLKNFIVSLFIFLLAGCIGEMPEYNNSNSTYILFKTPTIKYADMGFISTASNETKVEIYSNAQPVMRLRITPNEVCLSSFECMSALEFNKKVLNASYPSNTLGKIFRGEEIFNGKGKVDLSNGFMQQIDTITYSVTPKKIYFYDSSNKVTIKIKKL